jgi:tRNA U34 5-methylaminomethyl-2-thiouridine-forming methyltransferase MnmC
MNGHPQYAEALALYALGALDNAQELAELEAHLGTCGECRRELEALRADAALLAFSAVGPKPPDRARQRLLNAIAAEPRMERRKGGPVVVGRLRPLWLSFVPVAVMLLLAVFSLLLGRDLRDTRFQLRQARQELGRIQLKLDAMTPRYEQAKAVNELLHAPDAQSLILVSARTKPQPQMKIIYSKQKGALFLMANNCPMPPPNKVYELWLLPANGGAPMPAGTFKPDPSGNGMMHHPLETAGIDAKGFAVTIEADGGSQTPTMPIVMAPAG